MKGKFDEKKWNGFVGERRDKACLVRTGQALSLQDHVEQTYLNGANTKQFLEDWYHLVQLANEYITKAEPWKKYKDEATRQEAIEDLEFLLRVVKQLGLLAAPLLINGFAKLQKILGNEKIARLDSGKDSMHSDFSEAFDMQEFEVVLEPMIMYEKRL